MQDRRPSAFYPRSHQLSMPLNAAVPLSRLASFVCSPMCSVMSFMCLLVLMVVFKAGYEHKQTLTNNQSCQRKRDAVGLLHCAIQLHRRQGHCSCEMVLQNPVLHFWSYIFLPFKMVLRIQVLHFQVLHFPKCRSCKFRSCIFRSSIFSAPFKPCHCIT